MSTSLLLKHGASRRMVGRARLAPGGSVRVRLVSVVKQCPAVKNQDWQLRWIGRRRTVTSRLSHRHAKEGTACRSALLAVKLSFLDDVVGWAKLAAKEADPHALQGSKVL